MYAGVNAFYPAFPGAMAMRSPTPPGWNHFPMATLGFPLAGYGGYFPYGNVLTQTAQAPWPPPQKPNSENYHPPQPPTLQARQSPHPAKPPQPLKKSAVPEVLPVLTTAQRLRKAFFPVASYLAVFGNVLGGMALLAASLPILPPAFRNRLKPVGLSSIAVAISLGSLSELGVGIQQKQPTLALANALFLLATPLFASESRLVRGLFLFLMGAYYAGFANIVQNKYSPAAGLPTRQQTVDFQNIPKTLDYMAGDHRQVFESMKRFPAIAQGLWADLRKASQSIQAGEQLYIQPSADRIRFSSFCHYLGGALLMGFKNPWVSAVGSMLAAVGGISSNLEWFAIGTQRKDWIGTALKLGMPLQATGKALFHTNGGYALEIMGQGLSYTLSTELNQSK